MILARCIVCSRRTACGEHRTYPFSRVDSVCWSQAEPNYREDDRQQEWNSFTLWSKDRTQHTQDKSVNLFGRCLSFFFWSSIITLTAAVPWMAVLASLTKPSNVHKSMYNVRDSRERVMTSKKGKTKENAAKPPSKQTVVSTVPMAGYGGKETPWKWASITSPAASRVPPIFTKDRG